MRASCLRLPVMGSQRCTTMLFPVPQCSFQVKVKSLLHSGNVLPPLLQICLFSCHMYGCFTCMHVRESHTFPYLQRPEESIGSLDVDLQKVVSHQAGAKSQTQVLWESGAISGLSALPLLPYLSSFFLFCFLGIFLSFVIQPQFWTFSVVTLCSRIRFHMLSFFQSLKDSFLNDLNMFLFF